MPRYFLFSVLKADLTFDRCFVQNLSSRGRNEVILVALEI